MISLTSYSFFIIFGLQSGRYCSGDKANEHYYNDVQNKVVNLGDPV